METQASFRPEKELGEEYEDLSSEQSQQLIESITSEVTLCVKCFNIKKTKSFILVDFKAVVYVTFFINLYFYLS